MEWTEKERAENAQLYKELCEGMAAEFEKLVIDDGGNIPHANGI